MTDDQTVTQALLPCPFCGGEAEEATSKGPTGERYRWAQCTDCGAMSECCDDSARHNNPEEPEPIDLWNTRTAHSGDAERWERIAAQRLVEISDKADEIVALSERVEALEGAGRSVCDGQATPASVNNLRTILNEGMMPRTAHSGEVDRLREAAQELLDGLSSTYRARNGREVGIEADDGEKCYIVHSDLVTGLRAALAQPEAGGEHE